MPTVGPTRLSIQCAVFRMRALKYTIQFARPGVNTKAGTTARGKLRLRRTCALPQVRHSRELHRPVRFGEMMPNSGNFLGPNAWYTRCSCFSCESERLGKGAGEQRGRIGGVS
jgi:hypothetical protein